MLQKKNPQPIYFNHFFSMSLHVVIIAVHVFIILKILSIFLVEFMGVDAKSPQHTAVHPMYVSYTSLPTTTLSNASTKIVSPIHSNNNNNHHQHLLTDIILKSALHNSTDKLTKLKSASVTNSPANNSLISAHKYHSYQQYGSSGLIGSSSGNLQRNLSFNLKRSAGYTEVPQNQPPPPPLPQHQQLSQKQLMNFPPPRYANQNHILDRSPSPPPVPPRNASQRQLVFGIENPFETSPFVLNSSQSPLQSLNAINENGPYFEPQNPRARPQNGAYSPQRGSPNHSLVARSPNLNRINARRRLEGSGSNGSRHGVNFCDQVRSPTRPLPYVDSNGYAEPFAIHRVKSQDRIVQRQRRHHNSVGGGGGVNNRREQRPRSYCSTNNNNGFIELGC